MMTTISEIMGCGSPTNKRLEHDQYATPEWCTQALARVEAQNWPETIWEPCAGEGDMSKILSGHARVIESDLIPWRPQLHQLDFLKTTQKLATAIITNPPYKHATAFIKHSVDLGINYHAWLLKVDFLCAQARLKLVNDLGYPARIWGLTERPDFLGQGGPTMNCAWFVWHGVNRNHSQFELLSGESSMTLRYELEPFASSGREASGIVESLFAKIIAALRLDPRFTNVRLQELELLFADARTDVEQRLFDELRDSVHLDDVDYVNGDGQ
jgi:hypothetical protein